MVGEHLKNITQEERKAILKAAQEERNRKIQEAIKNGAVVNYITSRISGEEQETHISLTNDGVCIIDTTIQRDITKFLKKDFTIISITYYKDTDTIAGIIFEGKNKTIGVY